jgi:hypothetical protein
VEVGYQGVIGGRLLVNASVYRNHLKDFITFLLPQVGTSLGRLNSSFGPYTPPSSLSPAAAAIVTTTLETVLPPDLFAALSNDATGRPVIPLLSFGNFGSATNAGVELGATYLMPAGWRIEGSYTGFHSNVSDIPENPCYPTHRSISSAPGGVRAGSVLAAHGRYRWVDSFQWRRGFMPVRFRAMASSISTAAIRSRSTSQGAVDVANLLDNVHYEAFGGDLLRRRALCPCDVLLVIAGGVLHRKVPLFVAPENSTSRRRLSLVSEQRISPFTIQLAISFAGACG